MHTFRTKTCSTPGSPPGYGQWKFLKELLNPGNKEINYYYPTSVLVTGQDIIFFWVARMIMAGMEYQKEKPFSDVYFTGMVRDKQGRKMSKQLGNSPDLLDLIDRFGADAVRFGIMISSPAGNDLLFDESSCEQGRNFNNKIWNALKLVQLWEGKQSASGNNQSATGNFAVQWFDNRLNEVRAEVEMLYKDFKLSEALKTVYSLIWDDFCSWYLEWVKPPMNELIDKTVYEKTIYFFEELMQLLHPFMPFVTEEIYHQLSERQDDICVKQQSGIEKVNSEILQQGILLKNVISGIRDVRNKQQIKPKETIKLFIETADTNIFKSVEGILAKQVNAESISYVKEAVANTINTIIGKDKFYIQAEQAIDTANQKEELLKELKYQQGFLVAVDKKLSNEKFVANAKPEVIALEKKKKADAEEKIKAIEESLAGL